MIDQNVRRIVACTYSMRGQSRSTGFRTVYDAVATSDDAKTDFPDSN